MADVRGKRLAPGIYEQGDELHVDLEEFVLAAGGDPTSDADRAKAIEAIQRVGAEAQIPEVEVREK
jgi:hypothetical protein